MIIMPSLVVVTAYINAKTLINQINSISKIYKHNGCTFI